MEFDALCAAFGINPNAPRYKVRVRRKPGFTLPAYLHTKEVDPMAETKRTPLGPGGLTRGSETSKSQTTIFVSHDAPTHVHKGRRMRGILEQVRKYLLARKLTPEGLADIFGHTASDDVPHSVPCDGEYIVRCAAPGGGFPTFPSLPGAYSTTIPYLMRAISSLHTMFGLNDTHVPIATLVERIDKTLDRLRGDPREA